MQIAAWDAELAQNVFRLVDLSGVACNAIMGGRFARDRRFDAVGFVVLAICSALGGGIVRDVMLQQLPVALVDPFYLSTALVCAAIAFLWRFDSKLTLRLLWVADALCLGCWAATGAMKTLGLGLGLVPAVLMGLITAVGGGIIRDVVSGSVPRVFGGYNLYATPAIVSALVSTGLWKMGMPVIGMATSILVSLIFTGLAQWRKWVLPEAPDFTVTMTVRQLGGLLRLRGIKVRPGWDSPRENRGRKLRFRHSPIAALSQPGSEMQASTGQHNSGPGSAEISVLSDRGLIDLSDNHSDQHWDELSSFADPEGHHHWEEQSGELGEPNAEAEQIPDKNRAAKLEIENQE